jgi:hypothetical protein
MSVTTVDPAIGEWVEASTHRTKGISIKQLFQRDGAGESFEFNVVNFSGEDFFSPRHRHNFDQIRIGLSGEMEYGGKKLRARTIGYFPEGTAYGPLRVREPSQQAILQFDGASRGGYVNYIHLDKATESLRAEGEFKHGFFYPSGDAKAMDAYQASWERATGRSMTYPEPRFEDEVYLHIDAFAWAPSTEPGVEVKHLAAFGERELTIAMTRVAPGATATIASEARTTLAFVLTGDVLVDDVALATWSAVQCDRATTTVTGGSSEAELVLVTLPSFDPA